MDIHKDTALINTVIREMLPLAFDCSGFVQEWCYQFIQQVLELLKQTWVLGNHIVS